MNHDPDAGFLQRRITEREKAVASLTNERQALRSLPFLERMRLGNIGMRLWIYTSIGRQNDTLAVLRQQLDELS